MLNTKEKISASHNRLMRMCFLLFFIISGSSLIAQITFKIKSLPEIKMPGQDIYIASNINGWNPANPDFRFQNIGNESYQITIDPPLGSIEYKFTKGSWAAVETTEDGTDIPNRILAYEGKPMTIEIVIEGWKEDLAAPAQIQSTAADNVGILKADFYMPQLNRSRKIWVYLPPDYENSENDYPVLYMHDGQNLFDASTSFTGEWNVDESLNELFEKGVEGIIVVGIENGKESSVEEYTPWLHPLHGGGQGDKYVDFIVKTLKPYVDLHYRTKSDRAHTAIMGSSLGGLISFYAALKYQDVFSKAGVFSPSFWFSDEVYEFVDRIGKSEDMSIYMLGGELESDVLVDEINAMVTTLLHIGFDEKEIKMVTHPDGKHNEQDWSREFKACYKWLFD